MSDITGDIDIRQETLDFCLFKIRLKHDEYQGYIEKDSYPFQDRTHCVKLVKRYKDMENYLRNNLK